jgi:hypothetical protein
MFVSRLATAAFLVTLAASAHSPEDTDPAFAPWFQSLKYDSGKGWEGSCCSDKDCITLKASDLKIVEGVGGDANPSLRETHYEVKDPEGPTFLPVPMQHVLKRYDNPTGKVVACIVGHQVICLVKASGT